MKENRVDPPNPFSVLLLGALLLASMTPVAAQFTFEPHELVTGPGERKTILTGFLLGGPIAELAVLSIDENDDRRLHIYAFGNGNWAPGLDAVLRPEVRFVDVANIKGRDRLLTYRPGHLNWFDPESATERELLAVTCSFNPPRGGEIPHVDITRDVNGDGRDDLVVPDVDGFWVLIQLGDGAFADPVKLGPSTDMTRILGADGYRYDPWSQSRIHEIDYDQDGRSDLVFWNHEHFEVFLQDERGLFATEAKTFTTDVAFDGDEISSLAAGLTGKVLHSLTDLNGDDVADLLVFSLEGRSGFSKHSTYQVHFGTPAPDGGTLFAPEVGAAIQSDGRIQLGMDRHDFDRDGRFELAVTTIHVRNLESSLYHNVRGFMGDSIPLYLEFFRMQGGHYPTKPNATRKIKLRFPPTHREPGWVPLDLALRGATDEGLTIKERRLGAFNSTVLLGDLTGDGRSDLLLSWKRKQLLVFAGVPGPDLFAQRPQKVAIATPHDGEYAWLADLNQDGKQDLLMHYPSTTEPHRVAILLAR